MAINDEETLIDNHCSFWDLVPIARYGLSQRLNVNRGQKSPAST